MGEHICLNCGVPIGGPTGEPGRVRLHCSKRCTNTRHARRKRDAARARLLATAPQRECTVCGEDMRGRKADAKFCSIRCGEVSRGQRLLAPYPTRICALSECGADFQPFRDGQRCCSERHGKMLYNRESRADGRQGNPPWDDKAKARWRARKERMRGDSDAETFSFHEVFDRDGWVCGICSGPVDPDLKWPDPLSVSLDHIVPVSRGGKHRRDNAQCSHLRCNVSKGAAA